MYGQGRNDYHSVRGLESWIQRRLYNVWYHMWTTCVTNRLLGKYHNCWWPDSCVARSSAVMIYSEAELPIQTVWLSGSSSVNNDLDPNLFLVYIRHYVFQIVISIERLLAHLNKISIPLDTFQCPICWCILKLPKFIVWGVFKTASNWAICLKYMAIVPCQGIVVFSA